MTEESDQQELVAYRLLQADEALKEAYTLYEKDLFRDPLTALTTQ
jgi:hypothetical protein